MMASKKLASLIEQDVTQPAQTTTNTSAISVTQNTPLTDLKLTSQGLFDESKAIWQEFIEFDQEHQLSQRVGAQLWRLTKAVGKPALVLSLKGIQTAVVTVATPEKRTALIEHFSLFQKNQPTTEAALETVEETAPETAPETTPKTTPKTAPATVDK